MNVGDNLAVTVPEACQQPTSQAGLSKDSHLKAAMQTLSCPGSKPKMQPQSWSLQMTPV